MTPVQVSEILAYASAAHPYVTLSKETVAVYVDQLSDLDHDAATRAVRRLVATQDRFPSPAGIRREVARLNSALAPTALDALAEVMEQVQRSSRGLGLEPWSHPLIATTVEAVGGVWRFRMTEQFDTLRAHFLRTYDKGAEQHDRNAVLSRGARAIESGREARRAVEEKDRVAIESGPEEDTDAAHPLEDGIR